jgi:hypothetical protein
MIRDRQDIHSTLRKHFVGPGPRSPVICPSQLLNGLQVDDNPLCFSGGKSLSIYDPRGDVTPTIHYERRHLCLRYELHLSSNT